MTIDKIIELIKNIGFDVISYTKRSIKLKCKHGHIFNKKPINITEDKDIICSECGIEDKDKSLRKLGFIPISIKGDKCTVKCKKCNHIFNRTWYAFNTRKNISCPECVESERWNVINSHLKNMNLSYVSDKHGSYTLKCKNNHIFKQGKDKIIKEVGCNKCKIDYRKDYIKKLGFSVIKNDGSKVFHVKCNKCDIIFIRDWNSFYNRKCYKCLNCVELEKKHIASKYGFTLTDNKLNNDYREFICNKCNYKFTRGWSSFLSRGCRECENCKKIKRKNIANYYGLDIVNEDITSKYIFKCNNGHIFERPFTVVEHKNQTKCPICYPRSSNFELEIKKLLDNFGVDYIINDRTLLNKLELDFYLPKYNLAIECNGDYWHSEEKVKDKDYHLNKSIKCKEIGIQLLHIFESNWIQNKNIWSSIIKNKIGVNTKVYARKCDIKIVSNIEEKYFLKQNHLQGYIGSKICYGLYYEKELMQLMSVGKSRFNKKYDFELLRLCTKIGYNVIGGASKLLKHFETEHKGNSIISYSNNLYSNGNIYKQLGFNFSHYSKPGYFYFKNGIAYNRQQFMKHKLKDKLEKFDPNLNEQDNMLLNGYYKVFDCGQGVWVKGSI